jgi:hypothetical protein
LKKVFRFVIIVLSFWTFSSLAQAQEVRLGFSIGAGLKFGGASAYPVPALPQVIVEVQVLEPLWVRLQIAPYLLVDEITLDLKYCFFNASNTPYIGVGAGIGLYFMAGLAPVLHASMGYQIDLSNSTRFFTELFVDPLDAVVDPQLKLMAGLTFRL